MNLKNPFSFREQHPSDQERIFLGIDGLSRQLEEALQSSKIQAGLLDANEDPDQSRKKRIKKISLQTTHYSLRGETSDQAIKRMDEDVRRRVLGEEARIKEILKFQEILNFFKEACKKYGTARDLKASPESSKKIKYFLDEFGQILKSRIIGLERDIGWDGSVGKHITMSKRKELVEAQNELAVLKKLADSAGLLF